MLDLSKVKEKDLWYVVGYITGDGCLSGDGRHITIVSKDYQILEDILVALKHNIRITRHYSGREDYAHRIQIASVSFYRFLKKIGLTPRKSLTLKELKIPNKYFSHFLRGVIDGDGSIRIWIHPSNGGRQWSLRIYSASKTFIYWLGDKIDRKYKVVVKIHTELRKGKNHNDIYIIKLGKVAGKIVLNNCYNKNCLSLKRKEKLALDCVDSRQGWSKYSKMKL